MAESVESAINEFYKLKNNYETEIYKKKKIIINNITLSSKEKKNEFKKLKPKCINCKRAGGTLFSVKMHSGKEEFREFRAVCGVIADPCNLNITIQTGKYELLQVVLKDIEKEIQDNKKNIIDDKNRLLFGLMTTETVLQKFEDVKGYIANLSALLETYLDEYNSITDNIEKKTELTENIIKSYFYIDGIKEAIAKFNKENNSQYIRDIANIYVTNLKPLLNKILNLKYKENSIHYDENTNTYNLIQNQYTIQSLEFTDFTNKVINYDVGLKVIAKKPLVKKGLIIESSSENSNSNNNNNSSLSLKATPFAINEDSNSASNLDSGSESETE
jgi:hypothetical protein